MKLENIKLCPQCGFPNKIEDTYCKYCETVFNDKKRHPSREKQKGFPAFFSEKKGFDPSKRKGLHAGWILPLVLAIILIFTGCFFFITALIDSKEFKLWLVSIIMLLYGWQAFGVFLGKIKPRPRR